MSPLSSIFPRHKDNKDAHGVALLVGSALCFMLIAWMLPGS